LDLISLKEGQSSVGLVGGAMGTLMELGGGPVAIRILGDLWHEGKVGTSTAVWLINEILAVPRAGDRVSTLAPGGDTTVQADSDDANVKPASGDASVQAEGDDEKVQAATLLYLCAGKLVPTKVTGHEARWYEWPDVAEEKWPLTLPEGARSSLTLAVYALLTSRPPGFWRSGYYTFPIRVLVNAMQDPWVNVFAAKLLKQLDDSDFLSDMDNPLSEEDSQKMQELCALESSKFVLILIADFRAWATGGHRRGIPRRHSAVGGQSERE
jgi:hypothetical protein